MGMERMVMRRRSSSATAQCSLARLAARCLTLSSNARAATRGPASAPPVYARAGERPRRTSLLRVPGGEGG